ncbi:MAG: YicC family protein [Myxococcales bacterium]|nr:YicC family protein [Myxococcales bacterium]
MLQSMTGFGRGDAEKEGYKITVEIRSLNHRYCDIRTSLPPQLMRSGGVMERQIRGRFSRGRLEGNVSLLRAPTAGAAPQLNVELARSYFLAYRRLATELGMVDEVGLQMVLNAPGVVVIPQDDELEAEGLQALLLEALELALVELEQMRLAEGTQLRSFIGERVERMKSLIGEVSARIPESIEQKKRRLESRICELNSGSSIDSERLAQEAALLIDKIDITEEIERINAHIQHIVSILDEREPVGRKLDFIVQEMNREVNTIGSKCADATIAHAVVEMKAELERFREQVQNVE